MQAHAQATAGSLPTREIESRDSTTERALRLIGVSDDGGCVVCVAAQAAAVTDPDVATPRYTLAIDERLRAAIRGGLRGTAQEGEVDMAPGLRPREIQSRIRAGATVEQVAAAAGCPVERIEGFAYPVLLERATVAEKARAARPLKGSSDTLEEIVTATLVDRGQQGGIEWDAFKDERGWVVALTWQAGRSENRAEWAYAARPGGGSVTALGAEAADLLEPGRAQLRPVDHRHDDAPRSESQQQEAVESRDEAPRPGGTAPDRPADPPTAARSPRRGHRPQMPSWEDVLLGTRSAEH
jgi:hypothetical protein